MKKILGIVFIFGLAGISPLLAQRGSTESGPRGDRSNFTEQRVERMTEALNLTAEQREAVTRIMTEHQERMRAATPEERRNRMAESREELRKSIQEVLTDDQKAKWEEFHERRPAAFRQRGDRPGPQRMQRDQRPDRREDSPRGEVPPRSERGPRTDDPRSGASPQSDATPPGDRDSRSEAEPRNERGPRGERGDFIKQRVERMTETLELTTDQQEAITRIMTEHREEVRSADSPDERRRLARESRGEVEQAIRDILTNEQKAKWREQRADMRRHRGEAPREERLDPPQHPERREHDERRRPGSIQRSR